MKTLVAVPERADPVECPEGGVDLRKAITVEVGLQALLNRIAEAEKYINAGHVYPTPLPVRTVTIDPARGFRQDSFADPDWKVSDQGEMTAVANGVTLWIPLDGIVPDGAEVTKLEALVNPGEARSGGSRMWVGLYERTINWSSPSAGSAASQIGFNYDDTTTNLQVIPTSTISYTMDKSSGKIAWMTVSAGNTAATFNDKLYAVRITFKDPGPRNF